ncbi:MAG: D-amino acid dehydrogenase [Burkholderiales bacterium]
MRVLVLGSGLLGTASAWFLRRAGHAVTVVDRQPASGLETSFANGGQISVSHAEPWANPQAPRQILKWLGREDAPLLFRLRADPAQWRWGLRFLFECLPGRTRENTAQLTRLGLYSRATLQALRAETGIQYDHLERGILHFFTDAAQFAAAATSSEHMQTFGCESRVVSADECVQLEPALRPARHRILGGTFTPSDESGNAWRFTHELSKRCAGEGVAFLYDTTLLRLQQSGDRLSGVVVRTASGETTTLTADAYVVALGSYSATMLRTIGLRIPVYPAKGYSITLPVTAPAAAPTVSLTDEAHKLVFSRLGGELRVAGTAELTGYDTSINVGRCTAIVERVRSLFPEAGDYGRARFWAGLRPATPSNVPLIGRSAVSNLYLNTGHGTLGWTLSCGSGRALADLMSGRTPDVDFRFLGTAVRVTRLAQAHRTA